MAARLNAGSPSAVRPPHAVPESVNALILFEDEHLLVVHKPSGINTHKPDRLAPDGLHEWLTRRKPSWRNLSVLHRLDKDTSGVLVFANHPAPINRWQNSSPAILSRRITCCWQPLVRRVSGSARSPQMA